MPSAEHVPLTHLVDTAREPTAAHALGPTDMDHEEADTAVQTDLLVDIRSQLNGMVAPSDDNALLGR